MRRDSAGTRVWVDTLALCQFQSLQRVGCEGWPPALARKRCVTTFQVVVQVVVQVVQMLQVVVPTAEQTTRGHSSRSAACVGTRSPRRSPATAGLP